MCAITEIEANYEALEIDFLAFFPDLAVFVGTRKVLAMAVKNQDTSQRQTFLEKLLRFQTVV
jgi:hypothetical protein